MGPLSDHTGHIHFTLHSAHSGNVTNSTKHTHVTVAPTGGIPAVSFLERSGAGQRALRRSGSGARSGERCRLLRVQELSVLELARDVAARAAQ